MTDSNKGNRMNLPPPKLSNGKLFVVGLMVGLMIFAVLSALGIL